MGIADKEGRMSSELPRFSECSFSRIQEARSLAVQASRPVHPRQDGWLCLEKQRAEAADNGLGRDVLSL